jgi:hypothetical protein
MPKINMDDNTLQNVRARTDAKLRYAEIHLEELRALPQLGGDEFDRAHQESFLYHLLGAKEAFLIELNAYYNGGLDSKDVTSGKLRDALKKRGMVSKELSELYALESDKSSWLFHAKEMRDHSTHVAAVARAFHVGGAADGQVWLKNPTTGESSQRHFVEEFGEWAIQLKALLERLRASAVQAMHTSSP